MPTSVKSPAVSNPAFIADQRIVDYGRLVETQRRLHRIFDRSLRSRAGISIVWYEALLRLARAPERRMPITELGDSIGLTSGGATRLADRLEEAGYIERTPCPTDRRILWALLTDKGTEVLVAATNVHLDDLEQHFVTPLTPDDRSLLREILQRLRGQGRETSRR